MALVVKDRVRETSTTTGTGTITLAGAVTGYQSFSAIGNANTTYYTIYLQGGNEWEVGIGTYTASGTTLSRDTILASSNGGSAVNFSAGVKDVFVTYPAGRSVYYDTATNVTLNALTLSGGTANGVLYLNGSKVATSGSALTFDGTNLSAGSSSQNLGTASARWGTVYATALSDGTDQLVGSSGTAVRIGYGASWTAQAFAIGASEQMRLTSTGLGIGTNGAPSTLLHLTKDIGGGTSGPTAVISLGGNNAYRAAVAGYQFNYADRMGVGLYYYGVSGQQLGALLDSSGNLGLGVTPSAMNTITAMQLGYSGIIAGQQGTAEVFYLGSNWYYNSGFKYKNNGYATRYNTDSGAHAWYTASSGTAGNAISFTQAMTLDSAGRLLVGYTTSQASGYSLQVNTDAYIYGVTVGRGAGAVSTNTAVGASALAANTTGGNLVAIGYNALASYTSTSATVGSVAVGNSALSATTTGTSNTAVGDRALTANTTGSANTAVGYVALAANTTGTNNTAVGRQSLTTATTAVDNTAVGFRSLYLTDTGSYNVAVGREALQANTTAANNTAVGYQAGYSNTTGTGNSIFGYQAGYSNITSSGNSYFGNQAGTSNTGSFNVAVGSAALYSSGAGGNNTALGYQSLFSNTTASNNTAVGYQAGYALTTGQYNTALGMTAMGVGVVTGSENASVGYASLRALTSGNYNVALGAQAMLFNTVASYGTAVGYQAGYSNTTGNANTSVGAIALYTNTSGTENTALGYAALYRNTTGNYNTAVGKEALVFNTTASNNTAVGYQAAYSNTTAANNTAVGYVAGFSTTTGAENTSLGSFALYTNSTGNYNVAIGRQALNANTTASNNTAAGYQAGYSNTTGASNVFVGYQAGYGVTTSNGQTFIGVGAGAAKTTGGNNTFIGCAAGALATTGTGNTFVGVNDSTNGCGYAVTTGSKNTIIGGYTGNQGGLDIRTANNYIVLSDGDGNPRQIIDASGNLGLGVTPSVYTANSRVFQVDGGANAAEIKLTNNTSGASGATGAIFQMTGNDLYIWNSENSFLSLGTNNTERMRLDSSGNLFLKQGYFSLNNNGYIRADVTNQLCLQSGTSGTVFRKSDNSTDYMTLDASGRLGIGETNPDGMLIVKNTLGSGVLARFIQNNASFNSDIYINHTSSANNFIVSRRSNGEAWLYQSGAEPIAFYTNAAERARITSGGYFKASNDGAYVNSTGTFHEFSGDGTAETLIVDNTISASAAVIVHTRGAANFAGKHYLAENIGTTVFEVAANGNVTNTNGSYGTISDQKLKQDIVDAGSQWADIKAIRFRKYRMKADVAANPDAPALLGVVAQELEQVSPGLVDEHPDKDADGNDLGTTTKTVKSSILLMKAAVALQEAMARIEKLEAEVAALKGA